MCLWTIGQHQDSNTSLEIIVKLSILASEISSLAWPTRSTEAALLFSPGKPKSAWPSSSGGKSFWPSLLAGLVVLFGFYSKMVRPVKLYCSLARFTASFRPSEFLQQIWRRYEFSTFIMRHLDWKQFFLFARCCLATFVDRSEVALAVTEDRLQLPAPMSSWSVPTPPVQAQVVDLQMPSDGDSSSGADS